MKKKLFILFVIFCIPLNVFSDSGHSTIVMDVDSGRILYKNNIEEKKLIASTTKIMTCIIVLENSDIEKNIVVGDEVLGMYGTNIYIEPGEELKIKDLLYGLMLRSGNDAAITLAVNTLGLEEFISQMNLLAKKIGMNSTFFQNPHGLDDETFNTSTAYDMALLARYAYQNKDFREIISTKKYIFKSSIKSYTWHNRMRLMNVYDKCIGGKNGYTPKAGKTLVSYAKRDDLVLTIVSLDDNDIYNNHKVLYNDMFSQYKNYLILDKNNFKYNSFIKNGQFYIRKSFKYPLKEEELNNVNTVLELYPETKNGKSGRIIIKNDDAEIGSVNVYQKKSKEKEDNSIFSKILKLFIR